MTIHCTFDDHSASKSISNKRAIGAAMFILFIYYTACVVVSELKRGTKVSHIQSHPFHPLKSDLNLLLIDWKQHEKIRE